MTRRLGIAILGITLAVLLHCSTAKPPTKRTPTTNRDDYSIGLDPARPPNKSTRPPTMHRKYKNNDYNDYKSPTKHTPTTNRDDYNIGLDPARPPNKSPRPPTRHRKYKNNDYNDYKSPTKHTPTTNRDDY